MRIYFDVYACLSFNPRSRKGNDARLSSTVGNPGCFNPRSRKGNDGEFGFDITLYCVSIHVPARGTTCPETVDNLKGFVSIHVPARGTTSLIRFCLGVPEFQSTFPQGERRIRSKISKNNSLFQSTFPQGERRYRKMTTL